MAQGRTLETETIDPLEWMAIVLAALSGGVHLVLGLGALPDPLGVTALLAAGGFAGAIVLCLLGWRRRVLYLVGIPFVGSQILLWYLLNEPASLGEVGPLEAVDKTVQMLLIFILVGLLLREPEGGP